MGEEMSEKFVPYELRPGWRDLEPIPQDDGPNPMVPIAYSHEYRSAMDMFRAIVDKGEHSERVLDLTMDIIKMNPGHYSVWAYRTETLKALRNGTELVNELDMLNDLVKAVLKSYQIWQHRRNIALSVPPFIASVKEIEFTTRALELDSKNYNTWAYRQWALNHFWGIDANWDASEDADTKKQRVWETELAYTDILIEDDVRNNSAWNHRFFVVFGSGIGGGVTQKYREVEYTKSKLLLARHNASAWNYLRGIMVQTKSPLVEMEDFVKPMAVAETMGNGENGRLSLTSYLAVEYLADSAAESGRAGYAKELYTRLAEKEDPMRRRYWEHRKELCREKK